MRVWKVIRAIDGMQAKRESLKRDERESEQKKTTEKTKKR